MNIKSVRFRLSVWYSFVLFVAIIVIFASFYLVMRKTLLFQTDNMLQSHSQKLVDIVTQEDTNLQQAIAKKIFLDTFSQIPGELVIVINASGQIVASSLSTTLTAETFNDLYSQSQQAQVPFFKNIMIGQFTMRILANPLYRDGQFAGVVFVGSPLDIINQSLHSLLSLMFVTFLILAVPTIMGGYFLAGQALHPISKVSRKISKISSENLGERIDNPKTQDELEELVVSFNRLLNHLDQAFKRERELIEDIAHELKTPLATIRSGVEITLRKKRTPKEYIESMEEVLLDADRMTSLLNNILDLAWSKADTTRLKTEQLNLSVLLEDVIELGNKIGSKKKIKLKADLEPEIEINGNKDKLTRAIVNIIDNAIKYSPVESEITVALTRKLNLIELVVQDQGIGIEQQDLPMVFKRLYRGANTRETSGSGIGLSLTQAIVMAHKGKISISSTPSNGTRVSITLPAIPLPVKPTSNPIIKDILPSNLPNVLSIGTKAVHKHMPKMKNSS